MKKISVLALIIMAALLAPLWGQSEDDFQVGLTGDGTGVVIVKYNGNAVQVRIPATIQGMPVREIGRDAFQNKSSLSSVVIPEGVTVIRENAFYRCDRLASVTLPGTLKEIESFGFNYCSSLASIDLPAGFTTIGQSVFFNSGLISVTWPAGISIIPQRTFSGCSKLTAVTIPEGVTKIGSNAFSECSALTGVALPSTIQNIDEGAFLLCSALTTVTIPASVTRIQFDFGYGGVNAFYSCNRVNLASQAALKRVGYTGSF